MIFVKWAMKIGILNFDKNFIELANIEEYFAAICRIFAGFVAPFAKSV